MSPNLGTNSVVVRTSAHPSTELDGQVIILQQQSGDYLGLNEVASDVWRWLETPTTPQELCARVQQDYEVESSAAMDDILDLLRHLHAEGLITIDG